MIRTEFQWSYLKNKKEFSVVLGRPMSILREYAVVIHTKRYSVLRRSTSLSSQWLNEVFWITAMVIVDYFVWNEDHVDGEDDSHFKFRFNELLEQ